MKIQRVAHFGGQCLPWRSSFQDTADVASLGAIHAPPNIRRAHVCSVRSKADDGHDGCMAPFQGVPLEMADVQKASLADEATLGRRIDGARARRRGERIVESDGG
eukprot:scaffold3747_cov240-Pinguiococcus_pyrenoidosus.AAC.11